jgi:hypothetical protein
MDAIARLDEYMEHSENKPIFSINDKEQAIWALRKIAIIERVRKEAREAAQAEIKRIQDWLADEEKRADQDRAYLDELLEQYHRAVLKDNPKLKTIKLPHGELQIRKQQPEYLKEDSALAVYVKTNRPELLIPQEPKVDWSTLKKSLQATDDGRAVDTETGEIVPGVSITERPAKFQIKLAEV